MAIHDDAVYVFHVSLLLFLDWLVYKKIIGKSVCFTNALKPWFGPWMPSKNSLFMFVIVCKLVGELQKNNNR